MCAPALASAAAVARPIPLDAPVTSAVLFWSVVIVPSRTRQSQTVPIRSIHGRGACVDSGVASAIHGKIRMLVRHESKVWATVSKNSSLHLMLWHTDRRILEGYFVGLNSDAFGVCW